MKYLFSFILLFCLYNSYSQTTISGTISDKESGEILPYCSVFIKGTSFGTTSNSYGFYSLTVDSNKNLGETIPITFSFTGYKNFVINIKKNSETKLNVKLQVNKNELKEVVVSADKKKQEEEIRSTEMSTVRLQMKQIKNIPTIAGETDLIKIVQLLPGVQGGAEGGTGLFVRGGDADQNLVLLDEAVVYNLGHLFGFFSVFNSDAIKDLKMIKGAFPSNYGGRLSSILDIKMKEGHENKIHGTGGIGLLSSRFTLEGPIKKEKMSFLISARRTYLDKVFDLVNVTLPYYFYDLNGKLNYKLNDKNRLFYSIYYGNDVLGFDESDINSNSDNDTSNLNLGLDFGFKLGNLTNTLRWNHIYNSKLFSNISIISTNFKYDITGRLLDNNLFISSNIVDIGAKADFDYYHSANKKIKFGAAVTNHRFKPNIISTSGDISSLLESSEGIKLQTQEYALYGHVDHEINNRLKLKYGLRLSGSTVKNKFYVGFEPRLAARYMLNEKNSLKLSYSRMNQYMHRVSSSTVALPTDLWYPITENIKPQSSDQIAFGFNHLFEKQKITLNIEGYYKWMNNLIEYREGANLILNDDFEDDLVQGKGKAYGAELLIKKDVGKFTGWISYTLSWAKRNYEELNNGKDFFAKYDRRHTASIVLSYQLSKRWSVSSVWVYQTGSRFTAQIGQYFMPNPTLTDIEIIPIYTEKNAVQMSPSHRLDLNFTLKSKEKRKLQGEWNFGCYNLYNRTQPYRVRIVPSDNGQGYKYEQPGLFGFIPSIAYNFKF